MSEPTAFVALIKIRPRHGCEILPPTTCGAWVRCYIVAENDCAAHDRLIERLEQDNLDLAEIEFLANYDTENWEKADDGSDAIGVSDCRRYGCLAYGMFWAYGHDAPDAECPH